MCIEGGLWVFPSCLTVVSLRITRVRETPREISSLPLGNTLGVHYFENELDYSKLKNEFTLTLGSLL